MALRAIDGGEGLRSGLGSARMDRDPLAEFLVRRPGPEPIPIITSCFLLSGGQKSGDFLGEGGMVVLGFGMFPIVDLIVV